MWRISVAILWCLVALGAQALAPVELKLDGELIQGALVRGKVAPGTRLQLNGKPVRVAPNGSFAIGFDRDAKATAKLVEIDPAGKRREHALRIASRSYDIQRVTGVPQRTVTPPKEQLERIRREAAMVERARAIDSDRMDFASAFRWPLVGRISGVYGSQRYYNGEPGRPHFGVDVAAPVGTPVVAPADAVVTLAQPDLFFSGGTLIMDHGYGVSSTFIHLSQVLVKEGQAIKAGQVVAQVGATGRASGPHLDWRINWFNVRIDPQQVVGPMPTAAASKPR